MIKRSFVAALLMLLWMPMVFASAQEVVAATDKPLYRSGEKVRVVVKNNTSRSVFSYAAGLSGEESVKYIERQDGGVWSRFPATCEWPDCDKKVDHPRELQAGKEGSFEFYPRIYAKDTPMELKDGVYRLVVQWQEPKNADAKEWVFKETRTPEFEIFQN